MNALMVMAEKGLLGDRLIRVGIRRLLRKRLQNISQPDDDFMQAAKQRFVDAMHRQPIVIKIHKANEQHCELSAAFFKIVLGLQLKYRSVYWQWLVSHYRLRKGS